MRAVRFVIAFEIAMWRSLYRWVFRRPRVSTPGATAFGYTAVVSPLLWAFIGVSAIELPILHLLLPWPAVRLIADIVSVYGLLWMFGLMASLRVHPHVVDEAGLRLRHGTTVDLRIPWGAVHTVRARTRGLPKSKAVQVEPGPNGLIAKIVVASRTDVEIVLREPVPLPLAPAGGEPVSELHIAVDDPAAFVRRTRAALPA
jgi:hypothetical protein